MTGHALILEQTSIESRVKASRFLRRKRGAASGLYALRLPHCDNVFGAASRVRNACSRVLGGLRTRRRGCRHPVRGGL